MFIRLFSPIGALVIGLFQKIAANDRECIRYIKSKDRKTIFLFILINFTVLFILNLFWIIYF